jgi:hopanoid biosynthesis associated RND transporter like protein HpnN
MTKRHREYPRRVLEWWTWFVQRHPRLIIAITVIATAAVLAYSLAHFEINVDIAGMISDRIRFRRLEKDFTKAYPNLSDTIVVILDADNADLAISSREKLAGRLRRETGLFKSVYEPGGGDFFDKNGLLFLSVNELEDFGDNMAAAQPLLALLSQDLSVRGLFSVLEKTLEQPEFQDKRTDLLFDRISDALDAVTKHRPYTLPWQELMLGKKEASAQRRQFLILRPFLDSTDLAAGEIPLNAVRKTARELGLTKPGGVRLRITGDVALNEENLHEVRNSIGLATLASLLLVSLLLYVGLAGSGRLIFAALATLVIGLIWTTGFAIVFVGSLNMISITFAVLFIGLGIDYSIQFCLRYRELVREGLPFRDSIFTTVQGVGRAILLSCITTAIGFYSFIPTAYAGVAQLGLISGTGMFISFFANLTILPALLAMAPYKEKKYRSARAPLNALLSIPYKHSMTICIAGLVLGIGSAALLPKVYFDYNPLNLYDPASEPVVAIKELFRDSATSPWTISVLARGEAEARDLAARLARLKEVKMALTLFDFVPGDQSEKSAILSDISFFMPPQLGRASIKHLSYDRDLRAMKSLDTALEKALLRTDGKLHPPVRRLHDSLRKFKALLRNPAEGKRAFETLEGDLLSGLPSLFRRLETSLQASPFALSGLPKTLVDQYRSADGRYRVQVFPREDIMDRNALARFVKAVQSVSPNATDAPVTIYESGKAVVASFEQAGAYALIAIVVVLLIEMKSFYSTFMILVPLILAMLLTGAASVLFGIPLNFANVIVVPLLLGTGVHSGLIFMIRYQTEPPADGNMLSTSTSRAVLFSALTTMTSTGSLSFSSHRGISSIGILLTICFSLLIFSTLVLLPALLNLTGGRSNRTFK